MENYVPLPISEDQQANPWQTLSKKPIYDNPWINVVENQVLRPDGKEGIYGVVSFKNKAIGIVPLDKDGYTWLVGQYRYALEEYCWEIPMGGSPKGIDLLEGAVRELKEETGITAASWEKVMRIHTSNSVTDEEGWVFLAEDLTHGATEFDPTEVLHLWHLPLKQAVEMALNNTITDAISIAGLLKVATLKGLLKM